VSESAFSRVEGATETATKSKETLTTLKEHHWHLNSTYVEFSLGIHFFFIALAVRVAICAPPPRIISPVGPGKLNHAKATTANKADQRLCRHLPELFEHRRIIPKMSFLVMKAGLSSPSPGVTVQVGDPLPNRDALKCLSSWHSDPSLSLRCRAFSKLTVDRVQNEQESGRI